LIAIATVVPMHGEARSMLAIAGLGAYAYFSGRAMQLWQGRGLPSPHRPVWRRHFLHERRETLLPGAKALPAHQARAIRQAR